VKREKDDVSVGSEGNKPLINFQDKGNGQIKVPYFYTKHFPR